MPEARFVLVEVRQKRAAFLRAALEVLEATDRATVVEARAELVGRDSRHREAADVVVSRSFGSPSVTAECAAPLLRRRGLLVVSDPPDGGSADRWPAASLANLGLAVETTVREPALTALRKIGDSPARFPRPVGQPSKRPLW